MPQPCSQPLKSNPFESYRDPVTGQWKVRYPADSLAEAEPAIKEVQPQLQRIQKRRRWKKPVQKKATRPSKVA